MELQEASRGRLTRSFMPPREAEHDSSDTGSGSAVLAQVVIRRLLSLGAVVAGVLTVLKGAVAVGALLVAGGVHFFVRGR